jgi:hypothetical protein
MRKLGVVGACLLLSLFAGLIQRPDDGTQVSISHPVETGAAVSGANHGKPLPRLTSAFEVVGAIVALAGLVRLGLSAAPAAVSVVRTDADDRLHRSLQSLRSLAVTRRGPPALV